MAGFTIVYTRGAKMSLPFDDKSLEFAVDQATRPGRTLIIARDKAVTSGSIRGVSMDSNSAAIEAEVPFGFENTGEIPLLQAPAKQVLPAKAESVVDESAISTCAAWPPTATWPHSR